MNIIIGILLIVLACALLGADLLVKDLRQANNTLKYYAKLQEYHAISSKELAEQYHDLIKQLGYDVERLGRGDVTQTELTDADYWAIYDRMKIRKARLKVADEELEEAEELYKLNS